MLIVEISLLLLVCCLSHCFGIPGIDSTSLMKKITNLSPRFQRILSLLPWKPISSAYKVADIGCDHGLLSVKMSTLHHIAHIYAADVSEKAASGARATLLSIPDENRQKIDLLVGDGLQPLLDKGVCDVDTLILSGMGVRSLFEILCTSSSTINNGDGNSGERGFSDYWQTHDYEIDTSTLDHLGVQRIIIQPWPPNFLPLQAFYSAVLRPTMPVSQQQAIMTRAEKDRGVFPPSLVDRKRISQGRVCTGEPAIDPSKALAMDPDSEWANEVMGHYEEEATIESDKGERRGGEPVEISQWMFEAQHVDHLGGYHYITSSFVRNTLGDSTNDADAESSGTFHLQCNPLFQRYASINNEEVEEEEREQWRAYLEKQIVSLERKQVGLQIQQREGQTRRDTSRKARPLDYNVDACLSLLRRHISNMDL